MLIMIHLDTTRMFSVWLGMSFGQDIMSNTSSVRNTYMTPKSNQSVTVETIFSISFCFSFNNCMSTCCSPLILSYNLDRTIKDENRVIVPFVTMAISFLCKSMGKGFCIIMLPNVADFHLKASATTFAFP